MCRWDPRRHNYGSGQLSALEIGAYTKILGPTPFAFSTCAKNAQVAADGKIRQMDLYNLDMIIAVG